MATTEIFEQLYRELNTAQREAVDAIDGPVMVIAGPGTGKTKILTLRIANILARTDTPPEAILALTYTVNGAAEMQHRLAGIIGEIAYRIPITTFHGLCDAVIHEHPEHFRSLSGRRIAEDSDRRRIMEELFRVGDGLDLLASFGDEPYYLSHSLRAIESLKTEGISADKLQDILSVQERNIRDADDLYHDKGRAKGKVKAEYTKELERIARLRELITLYRHYETALINEKLYDYSDMITHVRDALEHDEDFRLLLQEQYQYLLVDEHQDTNSAQNRIVELLSGFFDRPNLFIVGDEKQAIYRFQGASLGNFMYFRNRFKDVQLITLVENYRSGQHILDAAHGVRASLKPLVAQGNAPVSRVATVEASSVDAEYFIVGRLLQQSIESGTAPEQIAVLYRNNADGQELAGYLARMGVPHALEASLNLFDDEDVGRLMLLLEAVVDYGSPGALYPALYVPWLKVVPLDVFKLTGFCGRERNPYDVIASAKLMSEAHIAEPEALLRISRMLAHWQAAAKQDNTEDALALIIRDSGCLDALIQHPRGDEKLAKLRSLYDVARHLVHGNRTTTLNDLTTHLGYIRDNGIKLAVSAPRKPGKVRLMTAHSAKGLEFDEVYIIDAYEGHWPSKHPASPLKLPPAIYALTGAIETEDEADSDERNLFYVALTRTRRHATICWPSHNRDGNALERTRYVSLIDSNLVTTTDVSAFESDYAANGQIRFTAPMQTGPDLSDKVYLNELFIRQGLSVTALNNYLTCPWQYFYRNLVRIPEPSNIHLMYGNAVDRALERFFGLRNTGEQVDESRLIALFEETAHEQPFAEHELKRALEKGRVSLIGWYTKWHAGWPSRSDHQVKISGIMVPGIEGATINGKLDKVEYLDDTRVNIIDYKTGKPKSRNQIIGATKNSNGEYLRQLTFYRVLMDHWKDGRYQMEQGMIDFIDPDDRGNYHKEQFIITKKDADELMEQIAGVCKEIVDLAFWDRRCDDKDCRYCALRTLIG